MKTIYQLQQIAARLRAVTDVNSISPEDTFGLQADVLEYLADMEQNAEGLGIHKVYASYAAMVADASAPVGSNGKALRFGQLVVIYDSSNTTQAESGNVYAWQKGNTGASAWKLMGNLGSVYDAIKEAVSDRVDIDTALINSKTISSTGTFSNNSNAAINYVEVSKGDVIYIKVDSAITTQQINVALYDSDPSATEITTDNVLQLYTNQSYAENHNYTMEEDGWFAFSCRKNSSSNPVTIVVRKLVNRVKEVAPLREAVEAISDNVDILNKSDGWFLGTSTMPMAVCKNLNEVITRLQIHGRITEDLFIKRFYVNTSSKTITLYIDGVTSGTTYLSLYDISFDGVDTYDYVSSSGLKITLNIKAIDTSLDLYSKTGNQQNTYAVINTAKCRYTSGYPFAGEALFDDYISDFRITGKDSQILNPAGDNEVRLHKVFVVWSYDASNDTFEIRQTDGGTYVVLSADPSDPTRYKGTHTLSSAIYGTYTSVFVIQIKKKPVVTITDTNRLSVICDQVYLDYYNDYKTDIALQEANDATDWAWKLQNYQWFWSSCNCLPFMVKAAMSGGSSTIDGRSVGSLNTYPSLNILINTDTHFLPPASTNPQVQSFAGALVRIHQWLAADKSAFDVIHSFLSLGDVLGRIDLTKQEWEAQWQTFWDYIDTSAKVPQLVCLGNHDINQDFANAFEVSYASLDDPSLDWSQIKWASKAEQRQHIIQPMLDRYKSAVGIVEDTNNASSCYYYFDAKYQDSREGEGIVDKYLRVIVLDVYDYPDTWDANGIKNYGYWIGNNAKQTEGLSLAQVEFVRDALADAITSGRDVCVVAHDFSLGNHNGDSITGMGARVKKLFSDYADKVADSFVYTDLGNESDTVTYDFTGGNGKLFFLHGHNHSWREEELCNRHCFSLVSAEGVRGPRKYVRDTADIMVYDEKGLRFVRYGNCPRQRRDDNTGDLLGFHFVDTPIDTSQDIGDEV